MKYKLDASQCRVLGALIEKDLATPDYYPLTLNSLIAACNQKSNRHPVLSLDEVSVRAAVQGLVVKHLARPQFVPGSRAEKYGHTLRGEVSTGSGFSREELAILAELLLRDAQTPGELRTRASRMVPVDSLEAVLTVLKRLNERADGPYVEELPREAGKREARFRHLFNDSPVTVASTQAELPRPGSVAVTESNLAMRLQALEDRVGVLEALLLNRADDELA